jgi:Flp pilus assembly pilin Flp
MSLGSKVASKRNQEDWLEKFARFGIISKGIVYCLVGVLTAMAAFGLKGKTANKGDAFELIYNQPYGRLLLFLVAAGMIGYVTWRFFQAFKDIDHKGTDTRAKFVRLGYAFSGVVYLTLAVYAIRLASTGPGGNDSGGNDSQKFIVAKILDLPAGEWMIGIAAALVLGNGIRQIYKAVSGKLTKNVELINSEHADVYRKTGLAGYISRGVVLLIIAYFFLRAAIHHNENEVQGTKGAFDFLENSLGSLLMGLVALGLVAYGIFMFVKGRYQKIDLNF